jgi:UV DNA damage endonuclease
MNATSPCLGLVCITTSTEVRYRTITRKRLLAQSPAPQAGLLEELYRDNIQTFDSALRFCEREGIRQYRIPSSIFPFADEPIGREVLDKLAPALAKSGERATQKGIRCWHHA